MDSGKHWLGLLAALASLPQPSAAQTIQVEFTGTVSGFYLSGDPFGMTPALGDPVSGTFLYDAGATGKPTSQGFKYPQPSTPYSITIDGHTVTPVDHDWQITIGSTSNFDAVHFEHNSNGSGDFAVDGVEEPTGIFQFNLYDQTTLPLGSALLPPAFPGLSLWDTATAFIRDDATNAQINMTLLTMTQSDVSAIVVTPDGLPYCTAGTSAGGCRALIAATGVASATTASGFVLSATGVEGARNGMLLYAVNGRQAVPWGNGSSFQCVAPPVRTGGLLSGAGTPGTCDGAFAQDLNARWCPSCPVPAHNPGTGAVVRAQLWYRDPGSTANRTTSLSNAVEVVVGP